MKIAMLAPIAWRTPPRHYGPWELVTSLLTEALVARGVDVTLFATLDSHTAGTLAGVVPAPYSEDPSIDAKVWEFRHLSHLFERAGEFDLIHNQADFPAHAFSAAGRHADGHDDPRLLVRPDHADVRAVSRIASIMSRSATPIAHRDCAMPRRSTTASSSTISRSTRSAATICCSSAASIPTRARSRRSRSREATGRRLDMAGIVQDQGYHDRGRSARVDGTRISYPRRGRRRGSAPTCSAGPPRCST